MDPESNIQEMESVVLKERSVLGEVLVEHEDMDATWDWVGAELPEDGCCIKASKARYCSGEKRTKS